MFVVLLLAMLVSPRLPADTPGLTALRQLWIAIISQPAVQIKLAIVIVTLAAAVVASRWLGRVVSREPARTSGDSATDAQALHLTSARGANGRFATRLIEERARLGPWLAGITRACIWVTALVIIALEWSADSTLRGLVSPRQLGDFALRVVGSLLTVAGALVMARVFQRGVVASLSRSRLNRNIALLAGRLAYMALLAVGLVIILVIWGAGVVFPVALIGALTVAFSFALQDVLKNLVSGVYLLLEHPFVIGDHITIAPYTGEIEDIQMRYTALRSSDGQKVIVPNSMLFSSAVVNHSAYNRRRMALNVTIAANNADAIEQTQEGIQAAVAGIPGVLPSPEPQVIISGAAAGKVTLQVIFWLPSRDQSHAAAINSEVVERTRAQAPDAEVTVVDTATAAAML